MASPENVLVNILNDFATFLGEKDKATFEDLKAKIDNLHQTVMGGEVDEELDTIREIVAELKKLKDAQGNTPQAILSKFTELETKIQELTDGATTANQKIAAAEATANAAKTKAEQVEQDIAQLPVTAAKAEAADTLSKANKASLEALTTKVASLEESAKKTDVTDLSLDALKQAYNAARG